MYAINVTPGFWPGHEQHEAGGCRGGWRAMTGRRGRPGPPGGGWGGPGGGYGRGPRARRGDVRAAILVLLDEEPRNGYGIMQELGERSGGAWRPSAGAVYPALSQLEDEGLVRAEESGGSRAYHLTDGGRAHVEEHRAELGVPWEKFAGSGRGEQAELRDLIGHLAAAVMQVSRAGTPAQREEAKRILADSRRAVYRLLADGDEEPEAS